MPVESPPDDAPDRIKDLLEAIENEFPHEHCFFAARPPFKSAFEPTTIWMYYPSNDKQFLEDSTFLFTMTELINDVDEDIRWGHVAGEIDIPDAAPDEVTELSKLSLNRI